MFSAAVGGRDEKKKIANGIKDLERVKRLNVQSVEVRWCYGSSVVGRKSHRVDSCSESSGRAAKRRDASAG